MVEQLTDSGMPRRYPALNLCKCFTFALLDDRSQVNHTLKDLDEQ